MFKQEATNLFSLFGGGGYIGNPVPPPSDPDWKNPQDNTDWINPQDGGIWTNPQG